MHFASKAKLLYEKKSTIEIVIPGTFGNFGCSGFTD